MKLDFDGRVVVVTGAGQGIGRGIALAFGEAGAMVIAAGREPTRLEETRQLISAAGGRAVAEGLDVAGAAASPAFAERVVARHGVIDVLVNNAGTSIRQPVGQVTEPVRDATFAVNTMAYLARALVAEVPGAPGGRLYGEGVGTAHEHHAGALSSGPSVTAERSDSRETT